MPEDGKPVDCEVQWLSLTYQIKDLEGKLAELRRRRLGIKSEVMRRHNCWGIREDALTRLVEGTL